MMTLRLDFHMGSVECVTCHVPCRKSGFGGVQGETILAGEEEGGRQVRGLSVAALPLLPSVDMTDGDPRWSVEEVHEAWSGCELRHQCGGR